MWSRSSDSALSDVDGKLHEAAADTEADQRAVEPSDPRRDLNTEATLVLRVFA